VLSRILSALSCRSERRDTSTSPTRQNDRDIETLGRNAGVRGTGGNSTGDGTTTGRNRATTTGRHAMVGAALVDTRVGSTGLNARLEARDTSLNPNARLEVESRQGTLDTAGRQLPDLPIPSSIANSGQRETRRRLSSVLDAVGLMD
jgi:hypothetical protein